MRLRVDDALAGEERWLLRGDPEERRVQPQVAEDEHVRALGLERRTHGTHEAAKQLFVDLAEDAALDDRDGVDPGRVQLPVAGSDAELEALEPSDQHRPDAVVLLDDHHMGPQDLLLRVKRRLIEVRIGRDLVRHEAEPVLAHGCELIHVSDDANAVGYGQGAELVAVPHAPNVGRGHTRHSPMIAFAAAGSRRR